MKEVKNKNTLPKPDYINFTKYKLKNGLTILLSEDHSIPTIALNICYHVGSKDEEPGKTGFAHLFEHLMFEGSANVKKGDYEKYVTKAGGENNAYTSEDKTNYYVLLPSNQLELGLWLESDRMLKCSVNKKSLETQKKVVIEERKQNFENRPYGTVSIELAPRLFPGSGYGWDTIGYEDDIRNANLEDIRNFFEKYYIPNNAVLSVSGDLDTESAVKMIEHYFSGIRSGPAVSRKTYSFNNNNRKIFGEITDHVQFPGIFISYRIPRENTKESYAFELLSEILSSGDSSRLYKELVYEKKLVSEVGCWADVKEHAGVLHMYCILLPGSTVKETIGSVIEIIDSICNYGVSETELEKAKNRIETKNYFRRQYILLKADMLAHYETFFENPGLINSSFENYSVITAEDINKFSKKYLNADNSVTLIYKPD